MDDNTLYVENNQVINAILSFEMRRSIALGAGLTDSIKELVYYQHLLNVKNKTDALLLNSYKLGVKLTKMAMTNKITDLQKNIASLPLEDKRQAIMEIMELQAELEAALTNGS